MGDRDFVKNFAAGAFFIIGIVLFFIVVFAIGKDKGLAQPKFQVTVLFRNIGGLTEGAPIRLAGVNIGTVASIDFLNKDIKGRRVKVTLNIFRKFKKQLEQSTWIVIKTEGILGGKIIETYVEDNEPPLDLTQPIIGEDPLDVQDLAEVFVRAAESFTKTSQDLSSIDIQGLTNVLSDSAKSLQVTSDRLNMVIEEMEEAMRKTKRLLDRIEQRIIDGNLFKVF